MAKHLKRAESRKSHSWWWDSHISPKNSKWLAENLEQMDESVKRMLKLIEEDGDSFAKKAEMYYQKRPQLILLVEEFYRMYRSLAERYDNLTGEVRKNISSDLQSQTSSISEAASELTSLAFAEGNSDVYQNEADDSSSLTDSGTSESDSDKDADDLIAKVAAYEANEKMQLSQDEITRLRLKVQKYKSWEGAVYESTQEKTIKIQEASVALPIQQEPGVYDHDSVDILEQLSDQLVAVFESAQKNDTTWESKLNSEGLEICKLQERIDSLLAVLSERECKIRELEMAVSDAERKALVEKAKFEAEIANLLEEQTLLKGQLREYMSRSESLIEENASIRMEKTDCETSLNCKIEQLKEEIDTRDARILTLERSLEAVKFDEDRLRKEIDAARDEQMEGHLHQLHLEHAVLTANAEEARKLVAELKSERKELEEEVERKKRVITECWEEKREAIRQLCFSLEHYRSCYHRIRQRKRLAI